MGISPVSLLETSVLVAIHFGEIHLYATFVLTLVLVTLQWGAGDKEIVLRFNKFLFPFAIWGR
jgi:hypothetical protein